MTEEELAKMKEIIRNAPSTRMARSMGRLTFKDGIVADVFSVNVSYTYDGLMEGHYCVASEYYLKQAKEKGTFVESETVRDGIYLAHTPAAHRRGNDNGGQALRECRYQLNVRWRDPEGKGEYWHDFIWFAGYESLQKPMMEVLQATASKVEALEGSKFYTWMELG